MNKTILNKVVFIVFAIISLTEVIAEFAQNGFLMTILKPLILPLIIVLYLINTKYNSKLYILALIINWIANVLFLSEDSEYITFASLFYILSRFFVLTKVYKEIKLPTLFPFIIGTIPFMFLFIYLNFLIFEGITMQVFLITIFHSIVVSLMGGIALGSYIMRNDKLSKFLLVSSLFYAMNILLLGIKFYYIDLNFLKPTAMIFFILSHFSLLKFVLLSENER